MNALQSSACGVIPTTQGDLLDSHQDRSSLLSGTVVASASGLTEPARRRRRSVVRLDNGDTPSWGHGELRLARIKRPTPDLALPHEPCVCRYSVRRPTG